MKNIQAYYNEYIKPLKANDRIFIVQKILEEWEREPGIDDATAKSKMEILTKFRGIAKGKNVDITDEDWYRQ